MGKRRFPTASLFFVNLEGATADATGSSARVGASVIIVVMSSGLADAAVQEVLTGLGYLHTAGSHINIGLALHMHRLQLSLPDTSHNQCNYKTNHQSHHQSCGYQ